MAILRRSWGIMPDGTGVELFTLTNSAGMRASIATYGATLVELIVPDRNGVFADVVLGYDGLAGYLDDCCFFGRTVGRVSNRIGGGQFTLDGVTYRLDRNHGDHQLHGGAQGVHSRVWAAEPAETPQGSAVILRHVSADGEQGFPGTVDMTVIYTLTGTGLLFHCRATTDKSTVLNLTNHAYFNLSGRPGTAILDHRVMLNAHRFLATDGDQIPTGEHVDVGGTPFDFTSPVAIGQRIGDDHPALIIGHGYDHFYVLDDASTGLKAAARVVEETSGRVLDVLTTQPGLQFYTGNHLPEHIYGKNGAIYGFRTGFCLETQGYTDAPNHPEFPPVTLRPGETYEQTTEYRFSVKQEVGNEQHTGE